MKKTILFFLFSTSTIISSAQTNVDIIKKELQTTKADNIKLKEENKYLKNKLEFCSGISDSILSIKSFSGSYNIRVLSCKGDRSSQSVQIEIVLSHQNLNQQLSFDLSNSRIVDNIGNSFSMKIPNFFASAGSYDIFTDTPLKITYIVNNVLPETEMFKIIALKMNTNTIGKYSSPDLFTEIKNLKIYW